MDIYINFATTKYKKEKKIVDVHAFIQKSEKTYEEVSGWEYT